MQFGLRQVAAFVSSPIHLLSRRSRQRERLNKCIGAVHLFVRLLVCLSVAKMQKKQFSQKKQFRAMVAIDDLQEVVHRLFKEPIIVPLKSKMAEIRYLGS